MENKYKHKRTNGHMSMKCTACNQWGEEREEEEEKRGGGKNEAWI
jgi:hypothetical protein